MVTAFVVIFTFALLLLAGLVIDGGLTLAARVQAIDEAQAAARAGAQAIDLPLFRSTGQIVLDPVPSQPGRRVLPGRHRAHRHRRGQRRRRRGHRVDHPAHADPGHRRNRQPERHRSRQRHRRARRHRSRHMTRAIKIAKGLVRPRPPRRPRRRRPLGAVALTSAGPCPTACPAGRSSPPPSTNTASPIRCCSTPWPVSYGSAGRSSPPRCSSRSPLHARGRAARRLAVAGPLQPLVGHLVAAILVATLAVAAPTGGQQPVTPLGQPAVRSTTGTGCRDGVGERLHARSCAIYRYRRHARREHRHEHLRRPTRRHPLGHCRTPTRRPTAVAGHLRAQRRPYRASRPDVHRPPLDLPRLDP